MSDSGFEEEQLRYDLIDVTGQELRRIAADTTTRIGSQMTSIEASARGFEDVSERVAVVDQAMAQIDETFANVAGDASRNADRLTEVTSAMSTLETDFEVITGLLRTISSIAEQTNLLALNATIEATRAGEAGKGFLVVASEVKELSQTTKKSNENVQRTLGQIADSIRGLSSRLDETSEAIGQSLQNVNASQENISMVNSQMSEFGRVIQSNIEEFHRLSQQAHAMDDQASELTTIGETFTNLLELMNVQGLFKGSGNPIDRLAPLVEASEFLDETRFSELQTREVVLHDHDVLISATDSKGRITFANQRFYDVAEYEAGELLGKPHNVIRHPDMPRTAFADLWDVIKAGGLWAGIVKNRTATGGYYWVKAMVFPCFAKGEIVGYISVRRKPSAEEVESATAAYKRLA